MTLVLLILGLILLIFGAEFLVKGASRLAAAAGITPLIIGLTVVAFGTSAPELAVSVFSSHAGQADIAVGNIVGSNIFNTLFILGLSALITPLVVSQQLIRLDVPLMVVVSLMPALFGADGIISRIEGLLLFLGMLAYIGFLIRQSRKETVNSEGTSANKISEIGPNHTRRLTEVMRILFGLSLLVLGSKWLVSSSTEIARHFGVSELIIGLTIVAAGTSLPEVATSVIAGLRGERDIAVGNVVGSNIFNILSVLGLASLVSPAGIPVHSAALSFDIPIMIATAVACLPVFFSGHRIERWEGAVFLGYYAAYTFYLVSSATDSAIAVDFAAAMIWFAFPITTLTFLAIMYRSFVSRGK